MNKVIDFNNRFTTLSAISYELGELNVVVDEVCPLDSSDPLLNYIYGVNPSTGVPNGDLAIYLGDKANAEVREFISQNLMLPNNSMSSPLNLPDSVVNSFKSVISDDDIAQFSRRHSESREDYADRMKNYFDDLRYNNYLRKETLRMRSKRESDEE